MIGPIQIPDNEKLSEARERLGLSLTQVADELNLPVAVIVAIEESCFDSLHGEAFVCGVIRAYARLLGVESESLVADYKLRSELHMVASGNVDNVIVNSHLSWRHLLNTDMLLQHMKYRTAYGIAAIIALVILIRVCTVSNDSAVDPIVESTITIETAIGTTIVSSLDLIPVINPTQDFVPDVSILPAESPVALVNSVEGFEQAVAKDNDKNISLLSFTFVADCWVEVLDGDNQKIFASMQTANKKLVLTGKPPFRITLGYAPGVALSYNSQAIPISADSTNVAKLVLGNS